MTSLTRLQSTPGLTSIKQSSGPFVLPRDLSNEAGLIDVIDLRSLKRDRNKVIEVTFNDLGDAFACIDTAGHIVIFYIAKDRFVNVCNAVHPTATLITERNNGMLVIGLPDNTINVYNLAGKLLKQLKAHKEPIKSFAINYSHNLLLSQSEDACVLWNLSTFKIVKVLHSRHTTFCHAIFSPSEEILITCFQDSSIYFWNLETFQLDRRAFLSKNSKPTKMMTSVEGNMLLVVGEMPLVHIFNLDHEEEHQSIQLPAGCNDVKNMALLPDKQLVLLGGDGVLYCTDLVQGNKVLFTKGLEGKKPIVSFATNPQGKFLLTVAESGEVYLYDFLKLLNIADRVSQKRTQLGIPPEIAEKTLKPSNNEQLYHQAFSSKPLGSKDMTNRPYDTSGKSHTDQAPQYFGENPQQFGYEKSVTKEDPRSKKSRTNYYHSNKYGDILNQGSPQSPGLEQKGELQSPLDSLEEISDSFGPMHSPQSLSVDINEITKPYLVSFLNKYGIFPGKQRGHIWKFLLQLPLNAKIYRTLQVKGTHPAFKDFFSQYPKSKLSEKVQEILSCLAHYCEAFSQVEYLPGLIFPFVRIFGDQEVLCFEIILSFLINWGQHFLQNHPKPPVFLLQAIEKLLEYHEPYLFQHLKDLLEDTEGIGIGDIIWTFVQNMLTDILKREDWLALMDFLVLHRDQPKYLLYFLVGYLSFFKDTLLKETYKEAILNIGYFVDKKSEVDIYKIFDRMNSYMEKTPVSAILISFQNNLPLVKGDYPSPEFFTPQLRNYYQQMEEYLVEAERKRSMRREQLKEVYRHLEDVSEMSEKFRNKQDSLHEQRLKLKEEMIKDEEERLRKKSDLEQQRWDRRIAQIKTMEEDLRRCLEKQDKIRNEMKLEEERERQLKKLIEEEKLKLHEDEESIHNKNMKPLQEEIEELDYRYKHELERGNRLDEKKLETEQRIKDKLLKERSRQEDSLDDRYASQDRRYQQENNQSYEWKYEKGGEEYMRGYERERKMDYIQPQEWANQNKLASKEDSRYDRDTESLDYSRNAQKTTSDNRNNTNFEGYRGEGRRLCEKEREDPSDDRDTCKDDRTNPGRENMWEKRRNQVTSIGGETDSLQTDFEEDKKRQNELSFNQRNEGIRKLSADRKQTSQQSRKFDDLSSEAEDQKAKKEYEQEWQNRDRIDFEQTLRETERRILEDDKLKYEQIREAWREMNTSTLDEAPRKSPEEGRNRYLDNSREGREGFEGNRERLSTGNKGERSFTRDNYQDKDRVVQDRAYNKRENMYEAEFDTSKEEEKYLDRSGDERGNCSKDQKSREYYSNYMPFKSDDNSRMKANYSDIQEQNEDSRTMERMENPKEARRRSIGEKKNIEDY